MKKVITSKSKRLTLKPYRVWLKTLQSRIAKATSLQEMKDAYDLMCSLRQRLILETEYSGSKSLIRVIEEYSVSINGTGMLIKQNSPRNLFVFSFYEEKNPIKRSLFFPAAQAFRLLEQCVLDTIELCRTVIGKEIIQSIGEGYGYVSKLQLN